MAACILLDTIALVMSSFMTCAKGACSISFPPVLILLCRSVVSVRVSQVNDTYKEVCYCISTFIYTALQR